MKALPRWKAEALQVNAHGKGSRYRVLDLDTGKAFRLTREDVATLAAAAPELAVLAGELDELHKMAAAALRVSGDSYLANRIEAAGRRAEAVIRRLRWAGIRHPFGAPPCVPS